MPLKYIRDLFLLRKLYFRRVTDWEDPYEDFIQKQTFKWNYNRNGKPPFWPEYFGVCWTTLEESDAMWRIYSLKTEDLKSKDKRNDVAIKIKVDLESLEKRIKRSLSSEMEIMCRDVIYTEKDEIDFALDKLSNIEGVKLQDLIINTLFVKREAFKHECEFRVVIQIPSISSFSKDDHLLIPFDTSIIQEFVIDPRLQEEQSQEVEKELLKLGIYQYKIKKSKLYAPIKKHTFVVDESGIIHQEKRLNI